jgi:hypothetical protein
MLVIAVAFTWKRAAKAPRLVKFFTRHYLEATD